MDIPFFCSPEDMLNVRFFNYLLKSGGGFFFKTEYLKDKLFKVILVEYVTCLLQDENVLEICLERKRSRSGKI